MAVLSLGYKYDAIVWQGGVAFFLYPEVEDAFLFAVQLDDSF